MKCLRKFKWVKLPRQEMPQLKGRLSHWLKLAESAAFRKGIGTYCGHKNPVEPGMWAGGIVGVKAILGVKSRAMAFQILDQLQALGYLTYTLDPETKLLTYRITDWVMEYTGKECMDGAVYATPGHGFLCMPRDITERLAEKKYEFDEADAWLDLWCHTVFRDYGNAFSFLSPVIQYGKYGSMLTLETLGKRWGWEKTKVWRFFRKYPTYFHLYRLPNSYGCVIYNHFYPSCDKIKIPDKDAVMSIFRKILISAQNTHTEGTVNERGNRYTAWKSRRIIKALEESEQNQYGETAPSQNESGISVALSALYNARVIFSCRNCKNSRNCIYACQGNYKGRPKPKIEKQYAIGDLNTFFDLDRRNPYGGEIVFSFATG